MKGTIDLNEQEIKKVEPIVFKDNREDLEKRLSEYETLEIQEVDQIRKETAEKIFTDLLKLYIERANKNDTTYAEDECISYDDLIERAKQFGVDFVKNKCRL